MPFRHRDVGNDLDKTEWLSTAAHMCDDEAIGDILMRTADGWDRLAADDGKLLLSNGAGANPSWVAHSAITSTAALHPAAYVSSTDPGAVGAYKFWVDTTTSSAYLLKLRNSTDGAWLTL